MIEQSKVQACPLLCEEVPVTGVSRFQSKCPPDSYCENFFPTLFCRFKNNAYLCTVLIPKPRLRAVLTRVGTYI